MSRFRKLKMGFLALTLGGIPLVTDVSCGPGLSFFRDDDNYGYYDGVIVDDYYYDDCFDFCDDYYYEEVIVYED